MSKRSKAITNKNTKASLEPTAEIIEQKNLEIKLNSKRNFWFFGLFSLLLVLAISLVVLNTPKFIHAQAKLVDLKIEEATESAIVNPSPSATASPSASPKLLIPLQSGKSVRVPILMYHYIGNNPNPDDKARDALSVVPDLFDKQMGYIASSGYTPITMETLYAAIKQGGSLPAKPIMITFDDGYIDFYLNAYPILSKYHLHAISYIPTGLMDQGYYLHWNQIEEMDKSGLISFYAHSVHHYNMTSLSDQQLAYELSESKKVLSEKLGKPVNFFAYPYGISDERVWNATQAAGYLSSVGTWFGYTHSEGTLFDLPRIRIAGAISLEDFKQKI